MKGIIIYKGKYNATRQYADWLSAAFSLPVEISGNIGKEQLGKYDFVILGSPVYVGKLLLKDWLRQNVASLQGKKIFLFVVCGTPPDKKEKLESYMQASLPAEIRYRCEIFYLPGRMIMKELSWFDWMMMKIGAMLAKGEEKKEMKMEYDAVKKENLHELIAAIQKTTAAKTESWVD